MTSYSQRGANVPFVALLAMALVLLANHRSLAEPVFLGPLPYSSLEDSPFNLSGLGSTFFVEDFEDGALNTPGIAFIETTFFPVEGTVLGPSSTTDSVDADDGLIDGNGQGGSSLASNGTILFTTAPPINQRGFRFTFDSQALGELPTAFGFVWTDGPPGLNLLFEVVDSDGTQHVHGFPEILGDSTRNGNTSDDRFFGVIEPNGISLIGIFGNTVGDDIGPSFMEVDHIQYGSVEVPEPSGIVVATMLALMATYYSRIGRKRAPIF